MPWLRHYIKLHFKKLPDIVGVMFAFLKLVAKWGLAHPVATMPRDARLSPSDLLIRLSVAPFEPADTLS